DPISEYLDANTNTITHTYNWGIVSYHFFIPPLGNPYNLMCDVVVTNSPSIGDTIIRFWCSPFGTLSFSWDGCGPPHPGQETASILNREQPLVRALSYCLPSSRTGYGRVLLVDEDPTRDLAGVWWQPHQPV